MSYFEWKTLASLGRGLKFFLVNVPSKKVGSCLDPDLARTGLRGEGRMQGQACPVWRKESVGTQQRWGRHEKRQRRTHSGRDAGGSVANILRRLLIYHLHWSSVNTQAEITPGTGIVWAKLGTNSLVRYFVTVSNDR